MSPVKLFTFNASSFPLDPAVESFLKSKGAITLDFGTSAYVNSEMVPAVLLELIGKEKIEIHSNADLVAHLKAEAGRYSTERQNIIDDSNRLTAQLKAQSAEVAVLKEQAADAARTIETLKAENALLQSALKNLPAAPRSQPAIADDKMKQSFEKLQKDYKALISQNAEALSSLKVLEDENEELVLELEKLKNQPKSRISRMSNQLI